jgi:DNA invertase Pin-like site-specific DNA recombinase
VEGHVIGYVRVSTEEQADSRLGLEAQRTAIIAEARRRGWNEADLTFIEDAGYTAKNLNRPGIKTALAALESGRAHTLVVAKLDRLTRSMGDFTELLQAAAKHRWALVALDLQVDTTTPNGEAMAYVIAVFANLERRLIGERTKAGLVEARKRGPLGRPVVLPKEVVDRIAASRASGATLRAIADELNADHVSTAQGGLAWYPATIRAVLRRLDKQAPEASLPARYDSGRCEAGPNRRLGGRPNRGLSEG